MMTFRNSAISKIIILEGFKKEELAYKIKDISNNYSIIDLQYAVTRLLFRPFKHHAILLLQRKN